MFEITNEKYSPIKLHVFGETKILEGRGRNNKLKLNVDKKEELPAQVLDLAKAGYLKIKQVARAGEQKKQSDEIINEVHLR